MVLASVYVSVFRTISQKSMHLGSPTWHRNVPRWVSKTHLFWGQKVKGQGHESQKNIPSRVFALLWVLPYCSCYCCSSVLQPTPSGSCSVCRTTLLGSSFRRQDDPTPRRCWTRCTGCPFSRELTTRWLCWLLRSAARRRRPTSIAYSSRTEGTFTICDDDRPLRRCADRSPRQLWQSAHSAAQHQPSGTRCQRQFWTVTL